VALINHAKKEINAKIVYYGPAGSGKNTALTYIFSRIKPSLRGELKSVPAGADNLLFFDFSPFETPLPNGYRVRLHVYTLTGTVSNPATWKMTLKGTDGIIIMVNPAAEHNDENRESVSQLRDFLSAYGVGLHETPAVLLLNSFTNSQQCDKAAEIAEALDLATLTTRSSNAAGEGLLDTLATLSRQIIDQINEKDKPDNLIDRVVNEDLSDDQNSPATLPLSSIIGPAEIIEEQTAGSKPIVTLLSGEIYTEGTTIRIPLGIQYGDTQSRFVVTVSVAAEPY
jgi:signal recognition particle receptor subunit beta